MWMNDDRCSHDKDYVTEQKLEILTNEMIIKYKKYYKCEGQPTVVFSNGD